MHESFRTIAVDVTPILPHGENGGPKIFVMELLKWLAEIAPEARFVLLTQATSHDELEVLDRINVERRMVLGSASPSHLRRRSFFRFPLWPKSTVRTRRGSATLLRSIGADLLFCPFTAPTYFEPVIPTVCTIYDLRHKAYPEFFTAEDRAERDRSFIEACRHATGLVTISDYSRKAAIVHGKLDPVRVHTILPRMAQRLSARSERQKTELDGVDLVPQRYLIYPANFWKHKNHEMLLTAFGMACRSGLASDVKLVCTGSPGLRRQWLMAAAVNMNLADRVLFPGYVSDAQLATLMANCGGVVFPSLYEGFGLPVIEAMAANVPVACSNVASLPEVTAQAALLFDPRSASQIALAMISLMQDAMLRERLILAGQKRAVEFSEPARTAMDYWELFKYVLRLH